MEEIIGLDFAEMGSKVKVDIKIAEGIVKSQTLRLHRRNNLERSKSFQEEKEAVESARALAQQNRESEKEDLGALVSVKSNQNTPS